MSNITNVNACQTSYPIFYGQWLYNAAAGTIEKEWGKAEREWKEGRSGRWKAERVIGG